MLLVFVFEREKKSRMWKFGLLSQNHNIPPQRPLHIQIEPNRYGYSGIIPYTCVAFQGHCIPFDGAVRHTAKAHCKLVKFAYGSLSVGRSVCPLLSSTSSGYIRH